LTFDSKLWSELKTWLFDNVFKGKCAYCEGMVRAQSFGDAEHWRPKGEVTTGRGPLGSRVQRDGLPHPGYWWLAYEWTNLLPACQECNSGTGKGTQFPVEGQHVFLPEEASTVDDLDRKEQPLLLHPLRGRDPAEHLEFDQYGQAGAKDNSPWGTATIDVFHLNRGYLQEGRRGQIDRAHDAVLRALSNCAESGVPVWEMLDPLWTGPTAWYSLAVRNQVLSIIRAAVKNLRAQMQP
jgi:hypothetical protein